jgi:hypothetical protein
LVLNWKLHWKESNYANLFGYRPLFIYVLIAIEIRSCCNWDIEVFWVCSPFVQSCLGGFLKVRGKIINGYCHADGGWYKFISTNEVLLKQILIKSFSCIIDPCIFV